MTHRFPIKEIARQAGLGTATVDRVLNNRSHVSPQTRARVQAALSELEAQEQQLSARGRRLFFDIVVEAPKRFSGQIRAACEAVLPELTEAVIRPRFLLQETMSDKELVAALTRIGKRGSHGVALKARDVPTVHEMVNRLDAMGIPVVTLVTDLPDSKRRAYVGIENAKAGRTAAYLLSTVLQNGGGAVLTSRSQEEFQGEAKRYDHFCALFRQLRPNFELIEITGGGGLAEDTRRRLRNKLVGIRKVDAVYSMGGGNKAILDVLNTEGLVPQHFVAHDLDAENRDLLQSEQISFVLHHDLKLDLYRAFRALMAQHGLIPPPGRELYSDVQIITPHNLPAGAGRVQR